MDEIEETKTKMSEQEAAAKKLKTGAADDGEENRGKSIYGLPSQIRDMVGYGASRVTKISS